MKVQRILYWLLSIATIYSLVNLWVVMPFSSLFSAFAVLSGFMLIMVVYKDTYKNRNERLYGPVNSLLVIFLLSFVSINIGFASIYLEMVRQDPNHFKGIIDGMSAIYFSLVTFATVGFGDVHPVSGAAKFIVMSEIMVAIMILPITIVTSIARFINHKITEQDEEIKQDIKKNEPNQLFRIK